VWVVCGARRASRAAWRLARLSYALMAAPPPERIGRREGAARGAAHAAHASMSPGPLDGPPYSCSAPSGTGGGRLAGGGAAGGASQVKVRHILCEKHSKVGGGAEAPSGSQ
jgi:hypothetical protein